MVEPTWLRPTTLDEALELRARHGEEALPVAGGTFLGILLNTGFLPPPEAFLSLRDVAGLRTLAVDPDAVRLGALVTHRQVETSVEIRAALPVLAETFAVVANERVRNQATVGGVLADADYASDPPATLVALGADVVLASTAGTRRLSVAELIQGHYATAIRPDELLVELVVPRRSSRATYLKFRSRSSEDRPCVGVCAAVEHDGAGRVRRLRVAVGAVADRPQYLADVCDSVVGGPLDAPRAREIAGRYADAIEPISDGRGSAAYRRRIIAVAVRRALEAVA